MTPQNILPGTGSGGQMSVEVDDPRLNHLKDRTMDPRFATLLGYTPEELDGTLRENVEAFGAKNGWDFATAKAKLLEWYDGYRFSPKSEGRAVRHRPLHSGDL